MNFNMIIKVIVLFVLFNNTVFGATELATFESFYVESSYIGWIVAGILALLAGAAILFTGGTATGIVAAIGTGIGNMAGLSGIAATNYGLALLGGGSIASGGLGVVGGVAVLTATLTFSTEVVIDYTLGNVINSYNYEDFVKNSKKMITLPIPQNEDGSKSYEKIVENLKDKINDKEPLSSNFNQNILLGNLKYNDLGYKVKDLSLLSYLHFATNDYKNAKLKALDSIKLAEIKNIKRTLPAFIFATSSLYDSEFNFDDINENYFRYSILSESDNKLIPLMFSIYLDRFLYRMNDSENLNYLSLNKIRDIAFEVKDNDLSNQSLVVVMMRYFIRIKLEQQKIISLTKSDNLTIKNSPKTLDDVKKSLQEYNNLINSLRKIIKYKAIQKFIVKDDKLKDINILYARYEESSNYLKVLINNLEEYQIKYIKDLIKKEKLKKQKDELNKSKETKNLKKEQKPWYKFW